MTIIGISGEKGAGKDLLADILVSRYGFIKKSFAAALKTNVKALYDLNNEEIEGTLKESPSNKVSGKTPRKVMEEFGQDARKHNPMVWVNVLLRTLSTYPEGTLFAIKDVRFPNEADAIRKQGGIVVRLERDRALNIYKDGFEVPSERAMDGYKFDFTLDAEVNRTPEDLHRFAVLLMAYLRGRDAKSLH